MSRPPVSVFLPAYNQVSFIDEAIRSAVDQDYDRLEVVCGDDGSTDGTADRIRDWALRHPGRVVPVLGPHVGITANCNRILQQCRGTYIVFHAGDDVYLPGKIRKQVEWLEEDERRVMCGHAAEAFDGVTGRALFVTTGSGALSNGRGAARYVERFGLFPDISVAARRSANPAGGYDERVGLVSCFKFYLDILASGGEYGYVEGVLARYRLHPGSISRRSENEPALRRAFLEGYLTALALTEANQPHLVSSCRKARAILLFSEGRRHSRHGDEAAARRYFVAAAHDDLGHVWKAAAACALAACPEAFRRQVETMVRRRRRQPE